MVDKVFSARIVGGDIPFLFDSAEATVPKRVMGDSWLLIVSSDAEEAADRIAVKAMMAATAEPEPGWIEKRFVGEELTSGEIVASLNSFSESLFIQECCTYSLTSASGGTTPGSGIAADYLIALSVMETGVKDAPEAEETGRLGPYRITLDRWQTFLDAHPEGDWNHFDRLFPLSQIPCVAWEATRAQKALAQRAETEGIISDDQPFIASFLNLLHAWILGIDGAWSVDNAHRHDREQEPLKLILEADDLAFNAYIDAARPFIKLTADTSIDAFVEETSAKLDKAFKTAFTKIRKHAPDFARTPSGTAPWMNVAETELPEWEGMVESDPQGREKVIEYFKSLYPSKSFDGTLAWCGAFAGHCMIRSGSEMAAKSLPNVAERAANWMGWGNREIRLGETNIPRGAIVVLHPAKGTNSSGHVCFYVSDVGDRKIACVGGNQSDTCRQTTYARSRIRAVRWLDLEPKTDSQKAHAATLASVEITGDAQIMAQTIWGEARGEAKRAAREAVASVIVNRVAASQAHFGTGHAGVCLQPWQFSCWNENDPNLPKMVHPDTFKTDMFKECLEIAQNAIDGLTIDQTGGATHYHAKTIAKPDWALDVAAHVTARIGSHIFYTGVA